VNPGSLGQPRRGDLSVLRDLGDDGFHTGNPLSFSDPLTNSPDANLADDQDALIAVLETGVLAATFDRM